MAEQFVEAVDLNTYGIEEVERNVCEDTFENRQILTANKLTFEILEPGLIEVTFKDYGELNKQHATQFEAKKIILVDPKNPWSDYQPFDDLPLDYMESAPAWIQRHLNKYRDAVDAETPEHKLPVLPERCIRTRADGTRCWAWSWPAVSANGFCRNHCSNAAFNATEQMNKLKDASKLRLAQLTGPSLEALEDLVINSPVPAVRLKAATEILDRVGIRGGIELNVSGHVEHELVDPAVAVRERLNTLAERMAKPLELPGDSPESSSPVDESSSDGTIVVGEVVEDETK